MIFNASFVGMVSVQRGRPAEWEDIIHFNLSLSKVEILGVIVSLVVPRPHASMKLGLFNTLDGKGDVLG